MAQIALTELRKNIAQAFDQVERERAPLVVTRQGRPEMAILPLTELEGIMETLHLLGTPANARRLAASIAQLDAGRGTVRALVEPADADGAAAADEAAGA